MRVAIVGSRDWPDLEQVRKYVRGLQPDDIVVSGGAVGVDETAEREARRLNIARLIFPAQWRRHGKPAGYIRNKKIVDAADRVVAFHYRKSDGTQHTIDLAKEAEKPLEVIELD